MASKNMLILGGSGFIGTNLINRFRNEYNIYTTIHKSNLQTDTKDITIIYDADLRKLSCVEVIMNNMDVVLHAAAVTTGSKDVIERPYLHVTDNAIINSIVFQEAYKATVRHVIFFSCTVMYQPKDFPQSEVDWSADDEIYPAYFGVGNMKVYSEKMCEFYSRLGDTKYTAIRHSNVYGPYDKFDLNKCHVVPAMVNKIVNSKDSLEVWGEGKAQRDIIYIDDLVDFVDKCIKNQNTKYELFNVGQGKAISILNLIKSISKLENKDLKLTFNTTKPDIPTTVILNCDKAKEMIGWEVSTPIIDGLQQTIDWYKNEYLISTTHI